MMFLYFKKKKEILAATVSGQRTIKYFQVKKGFQLDPSIQSILSPD